MDKEVTGECRECESTFAISYAQELVSQEYPEHCPFCGEPIEDITEQYIEDDTSDEDDPEWKWD
jgi:hypothetical protein